jgi:hypothetical protein
MFIIIISSEYRISQDARIFSHFHLPLTGKIEVMQNLTLMIFKNDTNDTKQGKH